MSSFQFEFKIPRTREELLTSQSTGQFSVSEIIPIEEIEVKLDECRSCIKELGCDFILEHFNTLFSILQHFKNLDFKILQLCYEKVIVEGLDLLNNTLYVLFEEDDIHPESRMKMLNEVKMSLFIAVQYLKLIQEKIDQTYSLVINKRGQKNTKLVKLKEDHNWDWEENERMILSTICKIIRQPLSRLWDPPTPEEEFVRMIEECCYSVFEKLSITSTKMKLTRDVLFEILAILITQYNNAISCKVKIVQMLKLHEHLVSVLAQAVVYFVQKHNCRSLIKDIIVEIVDTGSEMDTYLQDQSSYRTFSSFIVEVTAQEPELVLPSVNFLLPNLNCDPYSMRICALTVIAEIVKNILQADTEDKLTEEKCKTRDAFLEHLLDHIMDINVFVRSRVLKLWQNMIEKNAVPKYYVTFLLNLAIHRLNDKSANVVKNAIRLISIMLQHNPFGPLFKEDSVKQNLQSIKSKIINSEAATENPSIFKVWFCIRSEFSEFMEQELGDLDTSCNDLDNDSSASEGEDTEEKYEEAMKKELIDCTSTLQESIFKRDFSSMFSSLKIFDSRFLKRAQLLKNPADIVQYYQWVLGSICRGAGSVLSLSSVLQCNDETELKSLINQPLIMDENISTEFGADHALITYCEDYLKFSETMRLAATIISDLMMNRSVVEVLEAIEFFRCAQAFALSGVEVGLRNMLILVNSKEAGIKEAVLNTYKTIYLDGNSDEKKISAIESVQKLMMLLREVTYEQKTALNDLVKQWAVNGDLGTDFIMALWEKYCRKTPDSTAEESQLAAVLISMYASGKPDVVKTNLEFLIKYGLRRESNKNYALVKYTCQILRVLEGAKNEDGILVKYPMNSELIESFVNVVGEPFTDLDNILYTATALEAINLIYQLSESPDTVCQKLIIEMMKQMKNLSKEEDGEFVVDEELLIRILLIAGQVAFSQWQYLENDVHNELKRRSKAARSKEKPARKSRIEGRSKHSRKTCDEEHNATECNNITDQFEDDASALADERITDAIRMVCENELFSDDHLLGALSKLTVNICEEPEKYTSHRLQSAASMSLSNMMMGSSEYCDQNIQLFITILEKTKIPEVKINLILAFGDLMFRFPNTVEPWTVYFYKRLRDPSREVRYTAVLVVSHLITNEMIKVRGQMSDFALCLVDEDVTIKNHAFRLFQELSQKGNALYNVMPDIISRLTHPDYRTTEENFQTILKILTKLITKDRHLESIVEKLCHRFAGAADERQCVDLSYCLTLIPYNDRSLQKLVDNIVCYAEVLNHARVHKNFTNIIIICKKISKIGKLADLVQELENKIDIILTNGVDNLDCTFLRPAPKTPAVGTKTPRFSKSAAMSTRKSNRITRSNAAKCLKMGSDSENSE